MAIGSVNMSFDEWLKAENKTGEVKHKPVQQDKGSYSGIPAELANDLRSGKTVFQVANENPTKETAKAGGASSFGAPPQPQGLGDNAPSNPSNIDTNNNSPTILSAGATGHTPQSQAPVLASGLQASQGNENSSANGGPTSRQLNKALYAQYERAMAEAKVADQNEGVSTGEGTLSTGGAEGADKTGGAEGIAGTGGTSATNGTSGTEGTNGANNTSPTGSTDSSKGANDVPDEVGNKENPNDASNDTTTDINKQEEQRQQEILDSRRFKKFREEAA